MTLHQVAQHASDLERARNFYERHLDATFIEKYDPPGLLFMNVGNTRLLFEANVSSTLHYFLVDDVHSKVEELRSAGIQIETEPHVIFQDAEGIFGEVGTEERMAFIRDSEGNSVGLVSRHSFS